MPSNLCIKMGALPEIAVTKPGNSGKFIHYLSFLIHSFIHKRLLSSYCVWDTILKALEVF